MYNDFVKLVENSSVKFAGKNVSRETFFKIEQYMHILFKWNKAFNLVSRKYNKLSFLKEQVLPCINLFFTMQSQNIEYNCIYDIGSGAGIPGIILAILGMKNIALVERKQKKVEFQNHAIRELNLNNITATCTDIKNLHITCDNKKIAVVSKAVASCEWIVSAHANFSNKNTTIYLMKSIMQKPELEDLNKKLFKTEIHNSIFNSNDCVFVIRNR